MNGKNNTAYALNEKDIVNIENVTVNGNQDLQSVFDIDTDLPDTPSVNAKKLNASLNDKSTFMETYEGGSPTVNLTDSNIKAGYGLIFWGTRSRTHNHPELT